MPGRKNDPQYPVTSTPVDIGNTQDDTAKGAGSGDPTQVTGVDGKTVSAKDAPANTLFGSGTKPPNLPNSADGASGNPTTKTQIAQNVADSVIGGTAGGPGLPINNAVEAARSNASQSVFDADTGAFTGGADRVAGTLTRDAIAVARAPHYFSEQTDNVFLPDFLVFVCGANVTPHVKGTLTWTYGINDVPNTLSFTLDNSNDKFTITPENVIYNHFHAGDAPNDYGEFDESAKATIWLYKNNQLPLPVGSGFFQPNTPPEEANAGRRLPLNIYGSIFTRQDPVRVWIRVSQYDEWLPVFAGYITKHNHSEDWTSHVREVTIHASCIRDLMRKQRVQQNSIIFQMPGTTATGDGRSFNDNTAVFGNPSPTDPTATTKVAGSALFWRDVLRSSNEYEFAWSGMSFRQVSQYMTVGGFAPSTVAVPARQDPKVQAQLTQAQADLASLQALQKTSQERLQNAQAFVANPPQLQTDEERRQVDQTVSDYRLNVIPQLKQDIADYDQAILDTQATIDRISKQKVEQAGNTDPVHGVGRMDPGIVLRYPASYKQDLPGKAVNASTLDRWYRICVFGSPVRTAKPPSNRAGNPPIPITSGMDEKPDMSDQNVRYWTFSEITDATHGAGTRCRWDDLWAPDNQLVHWLLPPVGASGAEDNNITDVTWNLNGKGVRSWYTRVQLIQEFADMVNYRWWVTGVGDIVFEFDMCDFEPQDFGPWQDVLTVDAHALSSEIDEEGGDPPTIVNVVGSITGHPQNFQGENNFVEWQPGPFAQVLSPNMISRLGLKFHILSRPFITDQAKLEKLAITEFQRELAAAEQSSISLGFRPWLTPNRPIKFIPRDRISLTTNISHSMEVFGACTTQLDVTYTRQLDIAGIRRYITGGAHQPLSFGVIGGAIGLKESLHRRVEFDRQQLEHLPSLADPAERKKQLDANVSRDTNNTSDKFPTGYDLYNVADYFAFDNNGTLPADASAQERRDAMDAAKNAFASKQLTAADGAAATATTIDGITYGSSGVQSTSYPQAAVQKQSPRQDQADITIGVGSGQNALLAVDSDAAKQLQQDLSATNGFSQADVYNLAAIISSQTRSHNATPPEKVAVGWAVLNGAGANGSVKNLKSGAISDAANKYKPQWVDGNSVDIARNILSGQVQDSTNGATSFATYDPNVPYQDPRICNALTGDLVVVDPGSTRTVEGKEISDIGRYVFFKRNPGREAQATAAKQASTAHLPPPFDKLEDFIYAAAAKYKVSASVLAGYIKHENAGKYNQQGATVNVSGSLGAGLGWDNFEPVLFDQVPNQLVDNNRLIRSFYPTVQKGQQGTLRGVLRRANESDQFPSIFVNLQIVDASTTNVSKVYTGGITKATFYAGRWEQVLAAGDPYSVLRVYDFASDPLAGLLVGPRINIFAVAKNISLWLATYRSNSQLTVYNGKYSDMDLGGETIDNYYKSIYAMGSGAQVFTLLKLGATYNPSMPVDFHNGVPVPLKGRVTNAGSTSNAGYVNIINGMAVHGDYGRGGFAEFVLDEAYNTFWPIISKRNQPSLLDQCQNGDPRAISALERQFQNGQSLDQVLQNLYKKQQK